MGAAWDHDRTRASARRSAVRAIWNGEVLAQSDDTVVVEGNHYFPAGSINAELFEDSSSHTTCGWKGEAFYKTVVAGGGRNPDAAWYYPDPKDAAAQIRGRYAFWHGVEVTA
jgi:uncharacterized protein (DUF427 family)